jgi:tetratricopeptide (TPR) repeat protein
MQPDLESRMTGSKKAPNIALRRIREMERQESRAEFANALASLARKMGEPVSPSERYIARLEDGDVRFPSAPYRRVLTALCQRPISELGFALRRPAPAPAAAAVAPQPAGHAAGVAVPGGEPGALAAAYPPAGGEQAPAPDWPVWFGTRLVHLVALVDSWRDPAGQFGCLQAMLDQEVVMFDAQAPAQPPGAAAAYALSRRQALAALAALPLAAGMSQSPGASAWVAADAFLPRCAASLTACWHLLRGADLETVSQTVSAYIVALGGIARQSSRHQATAARLASQAHRISGIIALHRGHLGSREAHCRQALFYADMADDAASRAAALISLGGTYNYSGEPARATELFERALGLESEISPLLSAKASAGLAAVYGQLGREREAIHSIGRAQDLFPDDPEQDPSFLFADVPSAGVILQQGMAYLALAGQLPGRGYAEKAAQVFGELDRGSRAAPERIRVEIANHHAATAVHLNDLDAFVLHMADAIEGTAALRSAQRQKEAAAAWDLAAARWPREPRVLELGDGARLIRPDPAPPGS